MVTITTDLGQIEIELYPDKAPFTTENFLQYVDEDRFKGATFYRVVTLDNQPDDSIRIEVIQGGLVDDDHPRALPPIAHETTAETGIRHKDGVISMARWTPGTATGEFYICVNDQPELDFGGKRNPDGQGFAAFGRVIKGMDVVRAIQRLPEEQQMLTHRLSINGIERTLFSD